MGQPSLFSLQGEPTSSTPPSAHIAGEKTHFRQLTSCLSAQAIWSKSSWCTKESKMIYCNMEKNHTTEQQNGNSKSQLQISESKGSTNAINKQLVPFTFMNWNASSKFPLMNLFLSLALERCPVMGSLRTQLWQRSERACSLALGSRHQWQFPMRPWPLAEQLKNNTAAAEVRQSHVKNFSKHGGHG